MLCLEQKGAQGRGQGQRDDAGKHHGDGHGNGKLLVELAGDAAKEGDRHEHGTQDQHDGDQCALHFVHGLDGGSARRQFFLGHQAFDVFQHDDGVIDDDTDGQHHGEQGQGVDRKTEYPEAGKGADQ